jgi:glycosyltransferase involved in cell wall biosynthesis
MRLSAWQKPLAGDSAGALRDVDWPTSRLIADFPNGSKRQLPAGNAQIKEIMAPTLSLNSELVGVGPRDLPELSVVLPCLDEAATIGVCVEQIRKTLLANNISGEIIVADNGSRDNSRDIAQGLGARVVLVEARGYGSALMGGIAAARGKYIVMGDADGTYDFSQIPQFLEKLRSGYALVMGNRFRGGIQPGAMPLLHRYLGNPLLTAIGRLFFRAQCHDFYCGLRGFTKEAYQNMTLRTTGMEFASEMVVKASLTNMLVCELPTTLSPEGRAGRSHLRTWHDGFRGLRFLLLYSPRWLFLYPGFSLLLVGIATAAWLLPGPRKVGHSFLDIHTLLYAVVAILTGSQAVVFAFFTKVFGITEGLLPEDPRLTRAFRVFNLEKGLLLGGALLTIGISIAVYSFYLWNGAAFGPMNPVVLVRLVAAVIVSVTLGVEIILSSFFLSILGIARK